MSIVLGLGGLSCYLEGSLQSLGLYTAPYMSSCHYSISHITVFVFFNLRTSKLVSGCSLLQNSDSSKILNQTNLCSDDSMNVPNSGF